jgi:NADPH-dependent ferric siderophore reductase
VLVEKSVRPAYRAFDCRVQTVRRLSPGFVRLTLTGPDLDEFGDTGLDQRIKLVFPRAGVDLADFPRGNGWYAAWRALPEHRRHPFRTFSVRAVRHDPAELDVDVAVHSLDLTAGPALRFALTAAAGDPLVVIGPDALSPEAARIGIDWAPGAAQEVLLAGDETAAPAIQGILGQLRCQNPALRGLAAIEVPCAADAVALAAECLGPAGIEVRWLVRDGVNRGDRLREAVLDWGARSARPGPGPAADDLDGVDEEDLWDVPDEPIDGGRYAWIAAEATVVRGLRRALVSDLGLDRGRVAFMGYWRRGRAEPE